MNKRFSFYILLILCSLSIYAGDTINDLTSLSSLKFSSGAEKKIFYSHFIDNTADYISIFVSADSNAAIQQIEKIKETYNAHIGQIINKKFEQSDERKKITLLYKYVSGNILKNYELNCKFSDILVSGKYNSLTASMLFALLLNDLNIPFEIRENHLQVYAVAYPVHFNIIIESPDPLNRVINYEYRTKTGFVNILYNNYVISYNEYTNSSIENLFAKYYYEKRGLNISELAGLYYHYLGAHMLDNKKYKEALNLLEKAYMFYQGEKVGFVMFTALGSIINSVDYVKKDDWGYFVKIQNYRRFNVSDEQIIAEYIRLTQNILVNNDDINGYNLAYNYISGMIKDTVTLDNITFIYNYEMGRYLFSINELDKGALLIEKAFAMKPDNSQALTMLIASMTMQVRGKTPEEMNFILQNYAGKYPLLNKNYIFLGMISDSYLLQAAQKIDEQKIEEGSEYLVKFETLVNENMGIPVSQELVVRAYTNISVYYFRKSNYNKSKEYLQKGIIYAPNSNELKLRSNSF